MFKQLKSYKFLPILNRIVHAIILFAPVYAQSQSDKIANHPVSIKSYSTGKVVIIEGATHNGFRRDKNALEAVRLWVNKLN